MTNILGLNIGHPDTSACLLRNGELVAAVAEERLGRRIKHDSNFPANAIRWILNSSNLKVSDIDYIAISRNPRKNLSRKVADALLNPISAKARFQNFMARNSAVSDIKNLIAAVFNEPSSNCKFEVVNVEHHLAHISSSYFTSGLDRAKAVSFDGSGDFVSVMLAECYDTSIEVLHRTYLPHSLGHFYSALCQFIGFSKFGEEYKVMGLAPYGNNSYERELEEVMKVEGRNIVLNKRFMNVSRAASFGNLSKIHECVPKLYDKNLEILLGRARNRNEPITQREMDIAKSTQIVFENAVHEVVKSFLKPGDNLIQSGGCSLNGVNNAKILKDFDVTDYYLHPAAADDGTAVGAAFYVWNVMLRKKSRFHMKHAFWGPDYSLDEIKQTLTELGRRDDIRVEELQSTEKTIAAAAVDISTNKVIGWYQGASEWGPRALGNRSILANPQHKDMKNIINLKIKKRESFRPFAPSVLDEDVKHYFKQDIYSPFMMHVVEFKDEYKKLFPAVTHVDGTGRLQSVSKESNPTYHALIKKVKELTGHGVVLNTSFNENEPVVDTPLQAYACFQRTDMDVLYLKNFRIIKNDKC
jgi:carbamoyltransferase